MNRKIIGSILAVVLAAAGTFVLLAYVRAADDRAIAGERVVPVYVVKEAIAQGTRAEDLGERVRVERVPAKVLAAGGVSDLTDLEDKVAAVDLVPGEQLVKGRFQSPAEVAGQGAVKVPEGLQEVTVKLPIEAAVGGKLQAGDTVGVVSSFEPFDIDGSSPDEDDKESKQTPNTSSIILHKVLVTAVSGGQVATAPDEGEDPTQQATAGQEVLVTLAVEANSVEKIVFTAEFGSVWLSAEPSGAAEEPTQIETRGTIYE